MATVPYFLVILLICEITATKRSIISRFTNNPFFLAAFNHYPDYRDYHHQHNSDNRPTFFEKFSIIEPHTEFFDNAQESPESSHHSNFETDTQQFPEIPEQFKQSPHFEQSHQYLPPPQETEHFSENDDSEHDLLKFKDLPHYDQDNVYLPPPPSQSISAQDSQIPETDQHDVNDENQAKFNDLPHFDVINQYLAPQQPANVNNLQSAQDAQDFHITDSNSNGDELPPKFNDLPYFNRNNQYLPPLKSTQNTQKSPDTHQEISGDEQDLPHFEHSHYLPPTVHESETSQEIAAPTETTITDDIGPKFNELPFYQTNNQYLPPAMSHLDESQQILNTESSDIENTTENQVKFNDLPFYDRLNRYLLPPEIDSTQKTQQNSDVHHSVTDQSELSNVETVDGPPIESESTETNPENVELFKSVPLYEIHQVFQLNAVKSNSTLRKFKPTRKHKTGLPTEQRNQSFRQFGERVKSHYRNIAEIPLEDDQKINKKNVTDSYGHKII